MVTGKRTRNVTIAAGLSFLVGALAALFLGRLRDDGPTSRDRVSLDGAAVRSNDRFIDSSVTPHDAAHPPVPASRPAAGGLSLSGSVTDVAGRGLEGALVSVWPGDGHDDTWERTRALRERLLGRSGGVRHSAIAQALSDSDGAYRISLASIAAGRYVVVAGCDGHASASVPWEQSGRSSRLDFTLVHVVPTAGVVVGPDGEAVSGALVEARLPRAVNVAAGAVLDRAVTDAEGRFRLGVRRAAFTLVASAGGYSPSEPAEVTAGSDGLVVALGAAIEVDGRVIDAGGEPVAGARVSLYTGPAGQSTAAGIRQQRSPFWWSRASRLAEVETGPDGGFRFGGAPVEGLAVVVAERSGHTRDEAEIRLGELSAEEDVSVELVLDPAVTLAGTVVDRHAQPVPGALVLLAPGGAVRPGRPVSPSRAVVAVETDSAGAFRLDTLAPGRYSLGVDSERHPAWREDVSVDGDLEIAIELIDGVELRGRITSSTDGRPVPLATARFNLGPERLRRVAADGEGRYRLPGLERGSRIHSISVAAPDEFPLAFFGALEVVGDGQAQEVDFELEPAAGIAGVVTDESAAPVRGAVVTLAPVVERGGMLTPSPEHTRVLTRRGVTGDDGAFRLSGVGAGAFRIGIEHPDFVPLVSERTTVAAGQAVDGLHLTLRRGGVVHALVRDTDERPLVGASVELALETPDSGPREARQGSRELVRSPFADFGSRRTTCRAGPDGRAIIAGLDSGTYRLTVSSDGYRRFTTRGYVAASEVLPVIVDLVPGLEIRGSVRDVRGAPVPGADVVLCREELIEAAGGTRPGVRQAARAQTAPDGSFRLRGLDDGGHTLHVRARGYTDRRIDGVVATDGLAVILERPGGLSGRVTDAATGEPLPAFTVRVRPDAAEDTSAGRALPSPLFSPARRGRGSWSFEDHGGVFSIGDLAPGAYTLEVQAAGKGVTTVQALVEDGHVTGGLEIALEDAPAAEGVLPAESAGVPD